MSRTNHTSWEFPIAKLSVDRSEKRKGEKACLADSEVEQKCTLPHFRGRAQIQRSTTRRKTEPTWASSSSAMNGHFCGTLIRFGSAWPSTYLPIEEIFNFRRDLQRACTAATQAPRSQPFTRTQIGTILCMKYIYVSRLAGNVGDAFWIIL